MHGDKEMKGAEDPENIPTSHNHSPKDPRNGLAKDVSRRETRYSHAFDHDKNDQI